MLPSIKIIFSSKLFLQILDKNKKPKNVVKIFKFFCVKRNLKISTNKLAQIEGQNLIVYMC